MHGYKLLYGGNLNENVNLIEGRIVMHGYQKMHWIILTKMKMLDMGNFRILLLILSFGVEGLT